MFAKRPTRVADFSFAHLPLHVQIPPVPQLNWQTADAVMRIAATPGDETTWFTMTPVYRDEAAAHTMFRDKLDGSNVREAQLFGNDLQILIDSGFAIDSGLSKEDFESRTKSFCYVLLFSVVEERNCITRRRVIAWPKLLNEAEHDVAETLLEQHARVRFYSAREVRDEGVRYKYAASLDFKKFFQQFGLQTPNFFCFHFRGRVYKLATIPTGAVFPPLLAQALSRTLLAFAVRKANVEALVRHDCCIDNLRLMSDNLHALRAAWHELLALCAELGATVGDMTPPPDDEPTPYTYLGMAFSVVGELSRVELADKSRNKLDLAIQSLKSCSPLLLVDILAIFGQTVWASTVTGFKLGALYYVIKFVRRVQSKPLDSHVQVWPAIVDTWCDALRTMKEMFYEQPSRATTSATMYTDASESGWGVVIVDLGNRPIRIFGGRWSAAESSESINLLELRAIRIGIRILSKVKRHDDVIDAHLFVDNTTARAWTRRARARQWIANELALQVATEADRFGIRLSAIDYVRSYQNLADKPSRRL